MNLIVVLAVGLIAGLLASRLVKAKTPVLADFILGVIGSFASGGLFSIFFEKNLVNSITLPGIIVSSLGAVVLIGLFRLVGRT